MQTLSRRVAKHLCQAGIPAVSAVVVNAVNVRGRSVQTSSAFDRATRVDGRFVIRHNAAVKGRDVLVIDDIITTGATMRQCITVLQNAGATVVTYLALAHTPSPR